MVNRRYILAAGLFLIFEWLWVFIGRPSPFSPRRLPTGVQTTHGDDIFDYPAVDSEAIRTVCASTKWNPELIFTCENSIGGIANIRNSILICTRLAIAAGARLVLPHIIVRSSDDNISQNSTDERTDMSYMFDKHHFLLSLHLSCPQLDFYDNVNDIPHRAPINLDLYDNVDDNPHSAAVNPPFALKPEDLQAPIPRTGLPRPASWPADFAAWIARQTAGTTPILPTTIVELKRSFLIYPIYSDPTAFAHEFGAILKFRPDVRTLATRTFRGLLAKYHLVYDGVSAVTDNAFFGAHLRTEKDGAGDWEASRYSTQSQYYLNQTLASNLNVVYVASANASEVARLTADASPHGIHVATKFDVLSGTDAKALRKLSWDQQALVDYLVMLKASDFGGIAHSGFAWNIALKRHLGARRRYSNLHLEGPQMLSDELSQIYGVVGKYPEYALCLWP